VEPPNISTTSAIREERKHEGRRPISWRYTREESLQGGQPSQRVEGSQEVMSVTIAREADGRVSIAVGSQSHIVIVSQVEARLLAIKLLLAAEEIPTDDLRSREATHRQS
jgi:hypothetical protein